MIPINQNTKAKRDRGYALLELLFYVSFFAALSVAVIGALVTMTGAFRHTSVYAGLTRSGEVMERMVREARNSEDMSVIGAGHLRLNTRDDSGNPKTVEFTLVGTDVRLSENGLTVGNLNAPNIAVDSLSFAQISTTEGKAVKIELGVRSKKDTTGTVYGFYDTIALRGAY